jgi:type II secretory pathway predicted ATPase ExeA/cell division septation protein DedD
MSDGPLSYEPFFGLKKKPFSLASDPEFLYESPSHSAALLSLLAGIRRREGLLAFTGDVGTGKTTICRAVLRNLDRTTFSAFIPDPFASREDLLRKLLVDFGVTSVQDITTGPLAQAGRAQLSYLLSSFLDTLVPLEAFVVVFIDEAQNMSLSLLEEVRVLSDAFNRHGQLQVVFVGQLELLDKLKSPTMRQVDQRVSVYTRLDPLSPEDVIGYVHHRLAIAGASPNRPMFAPLALSLLHEASGGIPRIINRICDRALHLAYERRCPLLDRSLIADALEQSPIYAPPPATIGSATARPADGDLERTSRIPVDAEDLVHAPATLKVDNPAVFAHKVDAWLSHLDGTPAAADNSSTSFEAFASEADTPATAPRISFEAPLRRYRSERYIDRLGRRWARGVAIAAVALFVLNAVVAAASYVPARLTARLQPADLPPIPAAPPLALAPLRLPAPSPDATAKPDDGSAVADGRYVVAVGAYSSNVRAAKMVESLAAAGFRAFARTLPLRGRVLHQVWLGPFNAMTTAREALDQLRAAGDYFDAQVMPLPPMLDQAP